MVNSRYYQQWFEKEYLPSFGIDPNNPSLSHLSSRFQVDFDLISPYCRIGKFLDVGAGAGLLLEYAKRMGWQVYGVEPAEFGVTFAKEKFNIDIFHGRLEESSFEPLSFDVVFLQDTIEHLPNPREVLSRIHALLKPGGLVYLTTPNYDSLIRKLFGTSWTLISPLEHLCLFNPRSIISVFNGLGFEVLILNTTDEVNIARVSAESVDRSLLKSLAVKVSNFSLSSSLIKKLYLGDELVILARRLH